MTKRDQILNLVGTMGAAIIDTDDGRLQNFTLDIDSYEVHENEVRIFNLADAEFSIPTTDDVEINDNVISFMGYQIRVV